MKTVKLPILQFHLVLILLLAINAVPSKSQSIGLQADLSTTEIMSGDQIALTFSTDSPADIYFFSAEIEFDTDQLEFLNAVPDGAMLPDGEIISNEISPGVYGVSVTRTEPLPGPVTDNLLQVTFTVKQYPGAGEGGISYSNINFADSQGNDIDFNAPPNAEYTVEKTIVDLSLTTPATIDVTEGDPFFATGEVFATGITVDDENTDTLQVWVGVNKEDTDPSEWAPEKWELMDFVDQTDNDYFIYSSDVAFQRPVGTYYIALRSEIVNSGSTSYGGIGGFWDGTVNRSAELEIMEQLPFRYTVAEWDFDAGLLTPSTAIPANQFEELTLLGASQNGFTSDAANSNGWDSFVEGQNYWQVKISTENLTDLRLSSKQYSSGTGPGQFLFQWKTDGPNWITIGDTITVETNFTSGLLNDISLPVDVENKSEVYFRWVQASDRRADGNPENDISSGGTSRIDDIIITGINSTNERVDVWPGDTDSDGTVDENDLMPLGLYWLASGPPAIYPSIQFGARKVEEWVPALATYADANGDGRVNQNDLQPIGLHFNSNVPSGEAAESQLPPISELTLDPMEAGEKADIYLTTPNPINLSGISLRIDILGLDEDQWNVTEIEPLEWGDYWKKTNRLLQFAKQTDGIYAAAFVHKGMVEPESSSNLIRLRIKAEQPWQANRTVRLLRSSVTANGHITPLPEAELSSEVSVSIDPPVTERPTKTELQANYPNPFNPLTSIPFTLSEPGAAQIEIFDAIGRKVAGVRYDTRPAGSYTYLFDASALSSGVYLYRLSANGVVQTRKMLLLK